MASSSSSLVKRQVPTSGLSNLEIKRVKFSDDEEARAHPEDSDQSDFLNDESEGENEPEMAEQQRKQSDALPIDTSPSEPIGAYFTNPDQELGSVNREWQYSSMSTLPSEEHFELISPQDLDSSSESDYGRMVGMLPLKDILENFVLPPMQHPSQFELNGKRGGFPVPQCFFFQGRHGTGIRSLVRTFCSKVGANLIVASHPGFDARTDLRSMYELAAQNQPCIVLLIDADVQFGANSPNVTLLANILERQRLDGLGVYTIFRSENRSNQLAPQIQQSLVHSVWAGVPDTLERIQLWALALNRYMTQLPTRKELRDLAACSEFCIAQNIFAHVRASVSKKRAAQNKEFSLLSPERIAFQLNDLELPIIPGIGKRLTVFDPRLVNVAPFTHYEAGRQ